MTRGKRSMGSCAGPTTLCKASARPCKAPLALRMDWTALLASAGLAEPPGRPELVELIRQEREAALRDGVDTRQRSTKRKRRAKKG